MSLCQERLHLVNGEEKAGSQHLRDVEELRFDFVVLDHLMC